MKCSFCAEEIQDEAVVCRFCGATKTDGQWRRDPAPAPAAPAKAVHPKGHLSMRSAAVLLLVSALFELFSIGAPVPLFGEVREGAGAVLMHLLDTGILAGMGAGIWMRRRWGVLAVHVGTAIVVLEKLIYIFDRGARAEMIARALKGYEAYLAYVNKDSLLKTESLVQAVMILAWIGFAAWVHVRRSYFDK